MKDRDHEFTARLRADGWALRVSTSCAAGEDDAAAAAVLALRARHRSAGGASAACRTLGFAVGKNGRSGKT